MQSKGGGYLSDDNILLKKGETFREQFTVPSSGTSGHPIVIGSYGSGSMPVISSADSISGFSADNQVVWNSGLETESNNFTSEWSSKSDPTGVWSIASNIVHSGSYSAHLNNTGAGGDFNIVKNLSAQHSNYNVDFWIYFVGSIAPSYEWNFYSGSYTANSAGLVFGYSSSNFTVSAKVYNNSAATTSTSAFTIGPAGGWHHIQLNMVTGTSGQTNGSLELVIDGVSKQTLSGIANDVTGKIQAMRIWGSGNKPEFYLDDFTVTDRDITPMSNVWNARVNTHPYVAIANGVLGSLKASKASLVSPGDWFWGGINNNLSIYSTTDPSGTTEAGARDSGINTNGHSYLTIQDIKFTGANSNNSMSGGGIYISENSSYITIDNIDSRFHYDYGLLIRGGNNITVENSTFGSVSGASSQGDAICVYSKSDGTTLSSNITITGNTINGSFGRQGVALVGVDGATISNNNFNYISNSGSLYLQAIDLEPGGGTGGGVVTNVTITGNNLTAGSRVGRLIGGGHSGDLYSISNFTITNNTLNLASYQGAGIYLQATGGNNIVSGNVITGVIGSSDAGIDVNSGIYTIKNNSISSVSNGGGDGIVIWMGMPSGFSTYADIQYNVINGFKNGIRFTSSTYPGISGTVYNNVIYNPSQVGIYDLGSDGVTAKNNIVYYTGVPAITLVKSTGTYTGDNNLYYHPNSPTSNWYAAGSTRTTFTAWKSASNSDTNGIDGSDPQFVNPGTDFHLLPTSPAINAGTNVSLTSDYAGTSVPQGSAPDIGAYEYIPPSSSSSTLSSASPPSCGNSVTVSTPDLFEIRTNKNTATLYFAPPVPLYSSFYIAYSRKPNVLEYGVEYNQNYSGNGGVLKYTIGMLQPNTKYYFKIRAGNGCATGNWGNTMTATTTSATTQRTYYKNFPIVINNLLPRKENTNSSVASPNPSSTPKPNIEIPTPIQTTLPSQTQPAPKPKFCILWWCF